MSNSKTILIIEMDKRRATARDAQDIMTEHGCIIKTRLGIHDGVLTQCSDSGIIILELVGLKKEVRDFEKKLKMLPGVKTKAVYFPL
jgi:hypothetical protein